MVDDPIIHMPKAVKFIVSVVLIVGVIGLMYFSYDLSQNSEASDTILITMSLVQLLLTGLALLFIFGFSQRSLTFGALSNKTSAYLSIEVPNAIRDMHFKKPTPKRKSKLYYPEKLQVTSTRAESEVKVNVGHYKGDYRADYWIYVNEKEGSTGKRALLVDLNLNVQKALLVIKLAISDNNNSDIEAAKLLIKDWIIPAPFNFINGKEPKIVEHDQYLGSSALHIYLSAEFEEKFLVTPSERLFCAQAVSSIVRDLFVITRDKGYCYCWYCCKFLIRKG